MNIKTLNLCKHSLYNSFISATIFDIKKVKRDIQEEEHRQTEIKKEEKRYNPRAVILKRQARDKIVLNIPLPFNNLKSPITKVKRFVKKIQLTEKRNENLDKPKQEPKRKSKVVSVLVAMNCAQ